MFTNYKSKLWIIILILEIVHLRTQDERINLKTISNGETYCLKCNNSKNNKAIISLMKNGVIIMQSKRPLHYYIHNADILDAGDYSCYIEDEYLNTTTLNVDESEKSEKQKLWEKHNFGLIIAETNLNKEERKIEIFEKGIYCEDSPILRILESTLIGLQISYENPKRCFKNHKQKLELECKYQNNLIVPRSVYKYTISPFLSKILIPETAIKECTSFYGNMSENNLTFPILMSSNYFRIKPRGLNFKTMSFSFDFNFYHYSKLRFNIFDLKNMKMHSAEVVRAGKSLLYASNLPRNSQYCLYATPNEEYSFSDSIKCDIIIWTTHFERSLLNPTVFLERTPHNVTVKWSDIYAPKFEQFKITGLISKYESNQYTNKTNIFSHGKNFIIYSKNSHQLLQFTIGNLSPSTIYTLNFKYKFENKNFSQKVTGIKFSTKLECEKISSSLNVHEEYIIGRIIPHKDYMNIIKGYILTVDTLRIKLRFHMNKTEPIFILFIPKIKHKLNEANITVVFDNQSCENIYKYNSEIDDDEMHESNFLISLFHLIQSNLEKLSFFICILALGFLIDRLMTGNTSSVL